MSYCLFFCRWRKCGVEIWRKPKKRENVTQRSLKNTRRWNTAEICTIFCFFVFLFFVNQTCIHNGFRTRRPPKHNWLTNGHADLSWCQTEKYWVGTLRPKTATATSAKSNETSTAQFRRHFQNVVKISRSNVNLFVKEDTEGSSIPAKIDTNTVYSMLTKIL